MTKEIKKYNPFRELFDIKKEMDDFFNFRFPKTLFDNYTLEDTWAPVMDIEETKDEFIVSAELPGLKKEDIEISIDDNTLIITGKREEKKEEKEKTYHRIERAYGKFYRAVKLPREIDEEKIKAEFKNGVLEIKLPKTEKTKTKKIEIK